LANELLFGKLEKGGTVKVVVEGRKDGDDRAEDGKLVFEFIPVKPLKRKSGVTGSGADEAGDEPKEALVEAASRKALPRPGAKKGKARGSGSRNGRGSGGTVPSVPRKKR